MGGFASHLAHVRGLVAALAPQTPEPSASFEHLPGLPLDQEPAVADRHFDVRALPGATLGPQWGEPGFSQWTRSFEVRVRYDARADLETLEQRMAEDAESLAATLCASANFLNDGDTRAQSVALSGLDVSRDDPEFPIQSLSFALTYVARNP